MPRFSMVFDVPQKAAVQQTLPPGATPTPLNSVARPRIHVLRGSMIGNIRLAKPGCRACGKG